MCVCELPLDTVKVDGYLQCLCDGDAMEVILVVCQSVHGITCVQVDTQNTLEC